MTDRGSGRRRRFTAGAARERIAGARPLSGRGDVGPCRASPAGAILFALAAACAGAVAPPETRAEDLFDWPHRRPVVVSDAGAGALADVPVRLLLDAGSFSFAKAAGDGADLRAVADDGATPLPLWIESWDVAFEEATVWVRLPAIPAGGSTGFVLL
jgi:hypothetical protein